MISLESALLDTIDGLVRQHRFANRSEAIETSVAEHLTRTRRERLAEACARLDPAEERALAEEDLAGALSSWPAY